MITVFQQKNEKSVWKYGNRQTCFQTIFAMFVCLQLIIHPRLN